MLAQIKRRPKRPAQKKRLTALSIRKAAGRDAMPADDIETAYQLYAEEISQAWKTPR
jgi:hypothetical protein